MMDNDAPRLMADAALSMMRLSAFFAILAILSLIVAIAGGPALIYEAGIVGGIVPWVIAYRDSLRAIRALRLRDYDRL